MNNNQTILYKLQICSLMDKIESCANRLDFLRIQSELFEQIQKFTEMEEEKYEYMRYRTKWQWYQLPKIHQKLITLFLSQRDVQNMNCCCSTWTKTRGVRYNLPDWVFPLPCCQGKWEEKKSCLKTQVHSQNIYAMAVNGFGLNAKILIAQYDQNWIDYYKSINAPRQRLFVGFSIQLLCSCGPILIIGFASKQSTFLCQIDVRMDLSSFCEDSKRKEKGYTFPKRYTIIWLENSILFALEPLFINRQQSAVDHWLNIGLNQWKLRSQRMICIKNNEQAQHQWFWAKKHFVSSKLSYFILRQEIQLRSGNELQIYQGSLHVHPMHNQCNTLSANSLSDQSEELCVFSVDKQGKGYVSFYKWKCFEPV